MKDKLLILETRELSYASSHVFCREIAAQMSKEGVKVEHQVITNIERESRMLEQYIGKKYLAVLDINSRLPLAKIQEKPYLDTIDAPFVNILVDHPLHLHSIVRVPLKRGITICLDRYHADYLRRFYPKCGKVYAMPLAGTKAKEEKSFADRYEKVLFTGTYTPSKYYWEQLSDEQKKVARKLQDVVETRKLERPIVSFPELYQEIYDIDEELFAVQMHHMRAVERYLRERKREQVVGAFLDAGLSIAVSGVRWEEFRSPSGRVPSVYPPIDYQQMLEAFAVCRVILNIQPNFAQAPHDRISNAMMNGSVCLTDGCEWLDEFGEDGKDYLGYCPDAERIPEQVDKIQKVLRDPDRLEEMAGTAQKKFAAVGGWDSYCRQLLAWIREADS